MGSVEAGPAEAMKLEVTSRASESWPSSRSVLEASNERRGELARPCSQRYRPVLPSGVGDTANRVGADGIGRLVPVLVP